LTNVRLGWAHAHVRYLLKVLTYRHSKAITREEEGCDLSDVLEHPRVDDPLELVAHLQKGDEEERTPTPYLDEAGRKCCRRPFARVFRGSFRPYTVEPREPSPSTPYVCLNATFCDAVYSCSRNCPPSCGHITTFSHNKLRIQVGHAFPNLK